MIKDNEKIPVIIDCDPGVDDALAIILALSSEKLKVTAITSVAGNVDVEKTTQNALNIVNYTGYNIKVAKGAYRPLIKELVTAEFVHGNTGTGSAVFEKSSYTTYEKNAVETIYEEAINNEGELHIIALAPLTNIATALIKYPNLKNKIKHITLMGGATVLGNHTPAAEFNIYVDPEAADIVFKSGIPITMIGLDITLKALIYEDEINNLLNITNRVNKNVGEVLKSTLNICGMFGLQGAAMHDALAVAAVIDPTLVKTKLCHVDIETKGEFTYGKTVTDIYDVLKKQKNVEVGLEVNRRGFINLLKEMMHNYE